MASASPPIGRRRNLAPALPAIDGGEVEPEPCLRPVAIPKRAELAGMVVDPAPVPSEVAGDLAGVEDPRGGLHHHQPALHEDVGDGLSELSKVNCLAHVSPNAASSARRS